MVVFLFCLAVGRVGWILTKSTGDLTMCRIPTKPTTPNIGLNRKRLSISYDVEEKNIAGSFAPQSCPIHVALQFLREESCSCTGGYKPEVTNISNSRLREREMQSCRRQCCTALKLLCKHSISKVQAQYKQSASTGVQAQQCKQQGAVGVEVVQANRSQIEFVCLSKHEQPALANKRERNLNC